MARDSIYSLVTYLTGEHPAVGVMVKGRIWEINGALNTLSAPAGPRTPKPVRTMLEVLESWDDCRPLLEETARVLGANPPDDGLEASRARLLAPVPNPGKMMNVGLNFYDHAREMGMEIKEGFRPNFFWKGDRNGIIGPSQDIRISSGFVDWEAELALVIGKVAKEVPPESAMDCVAGFTCHNDVTDRRLMMIPGGQLDFLAGKCRDTFAPLGPALVPKEQIPDPSRLKIRCLVNGELMQDTGVDQMILDPAGCVSALSSILTLQPGDVIGLGTGSGVGWTRGMTIGPGGLSEAVDRMLKGETGVFLKPGDVVAVDIPGVGRLENRVAG